MANCLCTVDRFSIFCCSRIFLIKFESFAFSSLSLIRSCLCSNLINLSLLYCDIHLNFSFCSSILTGSFSIFIGLRLLALFCFPFFLLVLLGFGGSEFLLISLKSPFFVWWNCSWSSSLAFVLMLTISWLAILSRDFKSDLVGSFGSKERTTYLRILSNSDFTSRIGSNWAITTKDSSDCL